MKATGIIRRIDDLGRVVIPRELRRALRIKGGDPLEIYTGGDGEVIFKKYSYLNTLRVFSAQYVQVLHQISGCPALVCDWDRVIAAAGLPSQELVGRRISAALEDLMYQDESYPDQDGSDPLQPMEGVERFAIAGAPISDAENVYGYVLLLGEPDAASGDAEIMLIDAAAAFLGMQVDDETEEV